MYTFIILSALAALGAADVLPAPPKLRANKIVGGVQADIKLFPYQVSLTYFNKHFCGGSIISASYVLTAAHCTGIREELLRYVKIRAGSNVTYDGGSLHKIDKITPHKNFVYTTFIQNDIALIKVSPPFIFDKTRAPIPLYSSQEDIKSNAICQVTGYGKISENGPLSASLMAVDLPIVERNRCDEIYRRYGFPGVDRQFICAGWAAGSRDSCQGDSGGPIAYNGQLVGIVSFGFGCARPGIPGIYTNVAYFNQWIRDNMQ